MSYTSIVLADSPITYYRLGELSGSGNMALDATGHGYHATLAGTFTQGLPGAIVGDTDTATSFDSISSLVFPSSLNDTTFTAISLEFWINTSVVWQHVVTTSDGHTITVYLNGQVAQTTARGGYPVEIGSLFDVAGSPQSGTLDEVALYTYVLPQGRVSAHYLAGLGPTSVSVPSILPPPLPGPVVRTSYFGIGVYQSLSGGTTFAEGNPLTFAGVSHPFAGVYGGTYGYLLDTTIRAPQQTQYTPATEIGLDSTGVSVVRGYPSLTWTYTTMRPDFWYYLKWVYQQSAMHTPPPFQYLVLIQYPDMSGNNAPVQALARMDPPTASNRDVGAFYGVTLKFMYLGQSVLNANVPIQIK